MRNNNNLYLYREGIFLPYFYCALFAYFLLSCVASSAQCTMACESNLHLTLDGAGEMQITAPVLLAASNGTCSTPYTVMVTDAAGNLIANNTLTCQHIGFSFNVKVIDAAGNKCWGTVLVEDKSAPIISSCAANITITCSDDTSPNTTGRPTAIDNCGATSANLTITYFDTPLLTNKDCTLDNLGTFNRVWQVADKYSNVSTCTQTITVKRIKIADIVFPNNTTQNCSTVDTTVATNGAPKYLSKTIAQSNCSLLISHTDAIVAGSCASNYTIMRTWMVVDRCSAMRTSTQQIVVSDTNKPTITLPSNITVGTDNGAATCCVKNITIPTPTISDNCSTTSITNITSSSGTVSADKKTIIGTFDASSSITVTYTVYDACQNSNTASTIITVVDDDAPTVFCKQDISMVLDANGVATLLAKDADKGSIDNCCLNTLNAYQIKRMNDTDAAYADNITFSCNDIGTQNLFLKVTDCNGNMATCMLSVKIIDNTPPVISCPASVTIACQNYIKNTSKHGDPTVVDNCSATISFSDNTPTTCNSNLLTIVRTFTASDKSGNTATCTQQIMIHDVTPPTWTSAVGSLDATVDCMDNSNNRIPIASDMCSTPTISLKNTTSVGACNSATGLTQTKTYIATDLCGNVSNAFDVKLTIKADVQAPVFANFPASVFLRGNASNACAPFATLVAIANDNCGAVSISNDSPFAANKNTGVASGNYKVRKNPYTVTFKATDLCGNTTSKSVKVSAIGSGPTISPCGGTYNVIVHPTPATTISLADIFNITDDCATFTTDFDKLTPKKTFNCSDAFTPGVPIPTAGVIVTDTFGLATTCTVSLIVQCVELLATPPLLGNIVQGKIQTATGAVVEGANVVVEDGNNKVKENRSSQLGYFGFSGFEKGRTCSLIPSKNDHPKNGVTTYDLVLIQKHILGTQPLTKWQQLIAADANRSGTITAADMIAIRKMILEDITTFPNNNPSWRFFDISHADEQQDKNPDLSKIVYPENRVLSNITEHCLDANFMAVKVGDVNLSAVANSLEASKDLEKRNENTTQNTLGINIGEQNLSIGEVIEIPIRVRNFKNILGFQLNMQFNKEVLQYAGLEIGDLNGFDLQNVGLSKIQNGEFSVSWNDLISNDLEDNKTLFILKLKAKKEGKLSAFFNLNDAGIPNEAYSETNKEDEIRKVRLEFSRNEKLNYNNKESLVLLQNRPNPFKEETIIEFSLPESCRASLSLLDANGRLLKFIQNDYTKGTHEININKKDLPNNGTYFYQLVTPYGTSTKQMVLID